MKTANMTLKTISPFIWLAAFFCSLFFINDWQLQLFGAAVLLVFTWAVVTLVQDNNFQWKIPQSWVLRFAGAFWLLVFISVLGSDILNVSLMAFCFFSVMPLTFLVMSVQVSEKQLIVIGKGLAVLFAVLSVWGLLQFFVFSEYFNGRAHHPLANPNSFGALLNLGFFCALGWMLGVSNKTQKRLAIILTILIFGAIVATASRGAFFTLMPVLLFFIFMMREQVRANWRVCLIVLMASIGFLGLSLLATKGADSLALRAAETLSFTKEDVTSNRLALWGATAAMIKQHGILGTGIGTYFLYFPEFRLPEDKYGAFYAHSDPLQYWVELGVLGPIIFYAFIIAVIVRTVRAFKKANAIDQKLKILTPFCAVGVVILHTHVTFNLYNLSILFGVGFLLAVWFLETQKVLQTPLKVISFSKKFSPSMRTSFIALPFIIISILFSAYVTSEHFVSKARNNLLVENDLDSFAENIVMANDISLQGNYRSFILAVNVPMTLLEQADKNLDETKRKDIFDLALHYLTSARAVNPRSASALYYLAKIQQLVPDSFVPDYLESSEEYYRQSIKIDPLHVGARVELSKILERNNLHKDMMTLLEDGLRYRYNTSNAMQLYGRLMEVYRRAGDKSGVKDMFLTMQAFQNRLTRQEVKNNKTLSQHIWGDESFSTSEK